MHQISPAPLAAPFSLPERTAYGVILTLGVVLSWLSLAHPSVMPFWAPWDFSPSIYLAMALAFYWYWRGIALTERTERPHVWRRVAFMLGLFCLYCVLQTRFEYWSQHMFFLNRAQHVVMHHIAPFLIALSWPGAMLKRGMPQWGQRIVNSRLLVRPIHILQQPMLAALLFVGLFYLWLIPAIHFRAMLDGKLYAVMNWSMVVDGILFWCLVLDPRPKPPARVSFGIRIALAVAVIFPQIILGALISFAPVDLYPYYDLCGRLFPSIGALSDQQIGGIVSWIPPGMMSAIGVLLVLNFLRLHEESKTEHEDEMSASIAALASRWTGR